MNTPKSDGLRPGQAMRERAIHAPVSGDVGQGLQSAAEMARSGSEALDTHMGKISGAVANTFSPIDVGETAKLGSNALQITSMANARRDSGRQAAYKDAQARNEAAMDQMSLDVQANKMLHGDPSQMKEAEEHRLEHASETHAKKQQVQAAIKSAEDSGTPMSVQEKRALAESTFSAPTQEMETQARAHMLAVKLQNMRRKKKASGASDEAVAALGTGGVVAGSAARAVAANLRLGAKGAAVGADSMNEWEMNHTVGEEVTGDLAKSGHVISESDRPESSTKGDINRVARSVANVLPGFDSDGRPLLNSTKLSDKEKAVRDDLSSKIGDLDERAKQNLEARKHMQDNYTPDELTRREELRGQIKSLTEKGENAVKDSGGKLSAQDQALHDQHTRSIAGYLGAGGLSELRRADAKKAHDVELEKLKQLSKSRLEDRDMKFFSRSGSSHHFTDEEHKEHEQLGSKVKKIQAKAKKEKRDLTDSEQSEISGHQARMDDMKAFRDTGLTREERAQREKHESAKSHIDSDEAYGITPEEHKEIAASRRALSDLEETRKTGLNSTDRKALADAKAERAEQKLTKKTGLTTSERQIKQHLEDSRKGVYEGAAEEKDLVDRHAGKTVRKLGDKHYVGGLNSTNNVSEAEMEATVGGRLAQGTRSFGDALHFAGEVTEGSADTAQKYIDNNELAKAAAVTTGGAIKQGVSTASAVTVPVLGGVAIKAGLEGGGKLMQGAGSAISAVANSAAEGQDQRDRQKDLTTGERAKQVRAQAVNWTGSNAPEAKGLGSQLVDSLTTAASGAGAVLMGSDTGKDLKKDAVGMLPGDVADRLGLNEEEEDGPKKLTMANLSTATQDAIKGEAQDVAKGMAVSTGTDLVTKALAGHREDAPNARALRAFNREHHKKKKAEENRAAGLARQAGVRQQREAARAGGHDAELDGDAMQSLFHEPMPAPAPAPAPQPDPGPSPEPTPARHQRLPWWKRAWNATKRGVRRIGSGISSIGARIRGFFGF